MSDFRGGANFLNFLSQFFLFLGEIEIEKNIFLNFFLGGVEHFFEIFKSIFFIFRRNWSWEEKKFGIEKK